MRLSIVSFLLLAACAAAPESAHVATADLTLPLVHRSIDVSTPDGVIHTEAVYRLGTLLDPHREVVLLVPGTLANGAGYYDIAPGTGYNAAEILANAGYVAGLIDLPGTGESYRPADGSTIGTPELAAAVRRVSVRYRLRFLVGSVHLYGETGVGTNVGLLLAREPWVRSFVGSALFYREFGPAAGPTLFDPGFRAFVASIPGGYSPQDPTFIGQFFGAALPAIQTEATAACVGPAPGTVPTGALLELFAHTFTVGSGPFGPTYILDTPIVDAALARADALFIQAAPDVLGSEAGTAEMAAAYGTTGGGEATMVVVTGTTPAPRHLVRFDADLSDGPPSAFWSEVLAFLASH